jgi:uncharacterized membrane protein YagU involved in acid resistance
MFLLSVGYLDFGLQFSLVFAILYVLVTEIFDDILQVFEVSLNSQLLQPQLCNVLMESFLPSL